MARSFDAPTTSAPLRGVRTTLTIEWAWLGARLVLLAALAGLLYSSGTTGEPSLWWLLAGILVYSVAIAALLWRRRAGPAFVIGFILDNAAVVAGWVLVHRAASVVPALQSADLYLALLPLVIIGVGRLHPVFGGLYLLASCGWLVWATYYFQGAGSPEVEQLPARVFVLALTSALVMWLVSRNHASPEELPATTGWYEVLFRDMSDAVFVASEGGAIIDANGAAAKLLREDVLSLRGKRVDQLVRREDQKQMRAAFDQALGGKPVIQEVMLRRSDGHEVSVEICLSAVHLHGQVVCVGVARDVTERKANDDRMLRHERLLAMGQLASGIAHDLNNALTPIIGYAELLAKSPRHRENEEYLLKAINIMHASAQDVSSVLARLRQFYRERRGDEPLGPVDLAAIVAQVVELAEPRRRAQSAEAGNEVHIVTHTGSRPVVVLGHEEELRQALFNLLLNSMDAMPHGGTVTISCWRSDAAAVLEVRDDGEGMSPETLARCLEPFYTTKGSRSSGLGLPMVQGCVRRHGGSLDIESRPGEGTVVTLCLPMGEEKPVRPLSILVVDDDPPVRELLAEYVRTLGHEVQVASSGAEALQKFQPGKVGVVVTDMSMPGMSGMELGAAIKNAGPGTKVIMVTAFQDLIAAAGDRLWEAVDLVLHKPVERDALEEAITTVAPRLS